MFGALLTLALLAGHTCVAGFEAPALLTSNSIPRLTAQGGSSSPVFSSNGLHLVFLSDAANLVTNDDRAPYVDVFVYDLTTQSTELLSVNTSGVGGGSDYSYLPAISADGRFVSMVTTSRNLALVPPSSRSAQLLFDRASGKSSFAAFEPRFATLSLDGRFVAFDTGVPATSVTDSNNGLDVFVSDWQTSNTVVVSVNMAGTATGNRLSFLLQITSDGRYVLFGSVATDLVSPGPSNGQAHIYIRDLQSGSTRWVSKASDPLNATTGFRNVMSDDGRYVVYQAIPIFAPNRHIFFYDVDADTTTLLTSNAAPITELYITPDGRRAAYSDSTNVFVWDRDAQSNILVSVALDQISGANAPSHSVAMSADGERVCFLSAADNLVTNASNGRVQVYFRDLEQQTARLLTRNTNDAASNVDHLAQPAITSDGGYVAFTSPASDLVPGDLNEANDVFLFTVESGELKVISRPVQSLANRTLLGSSRLWPGSLSSNGSTVAFTSADNIFAAGDTNQGTDVFVYRTGSGTVEAINSDRLTPSLYPHVTELPLLSKDGRRLVYAATSQPQIEPPITHQKLYWRDLDSGLTHELTNVSGPVSLSHDGRWVGFHSSSNAADVAGIPDSNNASDVFIRDMHSASNYLVSWRFDGTRTANALSSNSLFSPNGRYVLFQSIATDAIDPNVGGPWNIFARDVVSNRTDFVSDGFQIGSIKPSRLLADFTPDSRFVVVSWILSSYEGQSPLSTVRYEFATRTRTPVCTDCRNASISDDGRFIAYETRPISGETMQVFVKDMLTGTSTLLSRTSAGGPGNGHSYSPQITPDGRFIVFESKASDLVPNDTNSFGDIFLADRLLGTRMALSVNRFGGTANALSSTPLLSDDGLILYFQSFAGDIVEGDYNGKRDLFRIDLGRPDSDGDLLYDDWEVAYFGDLSRDGTGDFDGDSHSDLDELRTGTDPTNSSSILRILTISSPDNNSKTLLWSAIPGRSYRVQYKDSLTTPAWNEFPLVTTASGSTATATDTIAPSNRFYRVVLAP